ncbi:hypothetical protein F5Y14DRAFT_402306 [Nemania sp. NC0429]|nr:hypothetical protein F5Y14DRAFT_402306 [Nemania sp. NC0429]
MKVPSTILVLLAARICGVAARGIAPTDSIISNTSMSTAEAIQSATIDGDGKDLTLTPQNNYGGWVNPEDLIPMPQCIAQQDQSAWLSVMTRCTSKRCTSYFAFICTYTQWLTQLSCLSTGFSPDVIRGYLPYCGRSVLAKAQLYRWVRSITGRTWLVDVGDANGLENLSPASLAQGYAPFDATYKAPGCLTGSVSAYSMEPFQRVMASCGFTSTTWHTGNSARPWEYSESLRSMTTLDSETAGYDLAGRSIQTGYYFDKECFCSAYTLNQKPEPCAEPESIDLTKERLWINATCGPTSLPDNWTDALKTTGSVCIPMEDWQWPRCVADIPKQVIERKNQCATDACEVDSSGYCKVKRSVDRACFCRDVSYDSCGGSCQIFETRIDYIKWLHNTCGNVQDWHGLPDNWRQLAAPSLLDLIPWRWTVKAFNDSKNASSPQLEYPEAEETCASNEWKLGSFALVNLSIFVVTFISHKASRRTSTQNRGTRGFLSHAHPSWRWLFDGILIAALQLLANWINTFIVRMSPGYEDVPVLQLMLLWISMPRPTWFAILLIGAQPFDSMNISAAASALLAETLLQSLSTYYMFLTVNYGREHGFYFGGLEQAERGGPAKIMYYGALMWLALRTLVVIRDCRRIMREMGSDDLNSPKPQKGGRTTSSADENREAEVGLLASSSGGRVVYGTFSFTDEDDEALRKSFVKISATTVGSMLLLWVAQWLFWGGFIGLSSEEYCLPNLEVLTAVWTVFSVAGATVGAP